MAKSRRISRLKPPASVSDEALLEWNRITSELRSLGLLEKSSRARLILYVQMWQQYEDAQRVVAKEGSVIKFNRGKTMGPHPAIKIMMAASDRIRRLLNDLGMTANVRAMDDAEVTDDLVI